MPTIQEKREKRGGLVTDARKILDKAKDEKREMTAEEGQSYDRMMDEVDTLGGEIEAEERASKRHARLEAAEKALGERTERRTAPSRPGDSNPGGGGRHDEPEVRAKTWRVAGGEERSIPLDGRRSTKEYRAAFEKYLRSGRADGLNLDSPERRAQEPDEHRDLSADADIEGGYLLAPMQMAAGLIKNVDDAVVVRQYATVIQLRNSQNLGIPSMENDASDAEWTTEIKTGSADTALNFGRRELNPTPVAKRIKVSRKLLRQAVMGIEALVNQRLGYKFGITEEKAFLTGTGANQPLGLFTASADGISTSRDVLTGSATNFTADGLIDAKFGLKAAYWNRPSTRWVFHRTGLQLIRKLKDTTNQYLWQPGLSAGEPDRILDIPYVLSEYVPNTFTTGLYVGLLGDLSYYYIAESLALEIQRLVELYAETNQIGFIGRMELDGMPVLGEAFVRLKTS